MTRSIKLVNKKLLKGELMPIKLGFIGSQLSPSLWGV